MIDAMDRDRHFTSYDDLIVAGHNKYALTIAVARRARQIHDGSRVLVETDASKSVTAALQEILHEQIHYGTDVEQALPDADEDDDEPDPEDAPTPGQSEAEEAAVEAAAPPASGDPDATEVPEPPPQA